MRKVWGDLKKWRLLRERYGYLPHYQKVGRLLMEVKFVRCPDDKKHWVVVNVVTGDVLEFRKNGTPINGTRGRLVGPIVIPRKVTTPIIKIKRSKSR